MNAETMQDSGVEWIGAIPKNWKVRILKRTTHIKGRIGWQGLTSNEYLNEGNYLLVTGTDFKAKYIDWNTCHYVEQERYLEDSNIQLQEDDVLVTKDGTIGKIAMVKNMPFPATLNSGVFVTRPYKNEYLQHYMYWVLSSDIFPEFIHYSKVGTTIVHLYQKVFERFKYPVPPLDEQKRIVDYLDQQCSKLDAIIAIKQQQMKTLDALRQSIIYHAVTKGLDDSVPLVDSGVEWLGKIPLGWKVKIIKREFDIKLGKMLQPLQKSELDTEEYYLKTSNIYWEGVNITSINKMWFSPLDKLNTELQYGDLLVCEGGDVGRSALWKEEITPCYIQNAINRVRSIHNCSTKFLYYWLSILKNSGYIDAMVSRITIAHLTAEKLERLIFLLPSLPEQERIADHLDQETQRLNTLKENLNQQINTLEAYKKSLIYECVTGKKRLTI